MKTPLPFPSSIKVIFLTDKNIILLIRIFRFCFRFRFVLPGKKMRRRLLLFLIIKSPLYFSARNFGCGSGNGWFVGEGEGEARNLIFRCIFSFLFLISCCGDYCCCFCFCFCCGAGIVALLSRTVEETNLGEGWRGGKGRRRRGGAVIVGVRNGFGNGFGEVATWAVRELGNFLGGGVFVIIIVLEVALPVENMCEYDLVILGVFFSAGVGDE